MKTHISFTSSFLTQPAPLPPAPLPAAAEVEKSSWTFLRDEKFFQKTKNELEKNQIFHQCRKEYGELICRIICFYKDNAKKINPSLENKTINQVEGDFLIFKENVTNFESDYFSSNKALVYGAAKEMFHEFENLLLDEKLPLQRRMDSITAMAPQMQTCSGGILTVLKNGVSSLKHNKDGIKGAAHQMKIQMMKQIIIEHMNEVHENKVKSLTEEEIHFLNYEGNEIHYSNVYLNYISESIGVGMEIDPDSNFAQENISVEELNECREKVLKKINPISLCRALASSYLDKVKGAQLIDASKPLMGADLTRAAEVTDTIKSAILDHEYGIVPNGIFLINSDNDDTLGNYAYKFIQEPTLLAKHFMETLRSNEVVNYDDHISLTEDDGKNGSIKMLGNLFWKERDGSCEELKGIDLFEISPIFIYNKINSAFDKSECGDLFKNISDQLLYFVDTEEIPRNYLNLILEFNVLVNGGIISGDQINPLVPLAAYFDALAPLVAFAEQKRDMNIRTPYHGRTALMLAAMAGNIPSLHVLVEQSDADVNLKSHSDGKTAAMYAVISKNSDEVLTALSKKIDISAQDNNGRNILMHAVISRNIKNVSIVMNIDKSIARIASEAARDDYASIIHSLMPDGSTPLMIAANIGDVDILEFLIKNGADVEAKHKYSNTALLIAAMRRQSDVVRSLTREIKREDGTFVKANINASNNIGYTATMCAIMNEDENSLKYLIESGADINIKNYMGLTALNIAIEKNKTNLLSILLNQKPSKENLEHALDLSEGTGRLTDDIKRMMNEAIEKIAHSQG
jgi:ankyrin repeat protein